MDIRTGLGYDIHSLKEKRPFILGGIYIPCEFGPFGHSDADVLTHAICDAMLGALCLGDIGQHFPDNDDKYKNISSLILLKNVYNLVKKENFIIANIDSTVILEKPKLAPFIQEIRISLAATLSIDQNRVSVKATTNEKMDSVGKSESIAAFATVLLMKKQ